MEKKYRHIIRLSSFSRAEPYLNFLTVTYKVLRSIELKLHLLGQVGIGLFEVLIHSVLIAGLFFGKYEKLS